MLSQQSSFSLINGKIKICILKSILYKESIISIFTIYFIIENHPNIPHHFMTTTTPMLLVLVDIVTTTMLPTLALVSLQHGQPIPFLDHDRYLNSPFLLVDTFRPSTKVHQSTHIQLFIPSDFAMVESNSNNATKVTFF